MLKKQVAFKKFHHDGNLISMKTSQWSENIFEPFWKLSLDRVCGSCDTKKPCDHFRYEFETSPETLNYLRSAGRSWMGEVAISEDGATCFRGTPVKISN